MTRTDVGILDLQMGNLRSVANAVDQLGFDVRIVEGAAEIDTLTHLIVPGVGAFGAASRRLAERGLLEPVRRFAAGGRPVLGLCLGMQLLATEGEEGGRHEGLDLVPGVVTRLDASRVPAVPHVGWNSVTLTGAHPVLAQVRTGVDFYFVHSFRITTSRPADVLGTTEYGDVFPAIVGRGNVVGFQFHPEKSQANGLRLIENFCGWDGRC